MATFKKSSSLVSSFSLLLQCWCSILVMMHCNHFKALNSKAQGSSLINGTFRRRTLTAKCGAILQMSIILMAREAIWLESWLMSRFDFLEFNLFTYCFPYFWDDLCKQFYAATKKCIRKIELNFWNIDTAIKFGPSATFSTTEAAFNLESKNFFFFLTYDSAFCSWMQNLLDIGW